jgi:hypothetical protein
MSTWISFDKGKIIQHHQSKGSIVEVKNLYLVEFTYKKNIT